jgi:predicted dinucleotide-binding enzyme
MFIAGDDLQARDRVAGICTEFGWTARYIGGIECARYLEPMSLVWAAYAVISGSVQHAFKVLGK